ISGQYLRSIIEDLAIGGRHGGVICLAYLAGVSAPCRRRQLPRRIAFHHPFPIKARLVPPKSDVAPLVARRTKNSGIRRASASLRHRRAPAFRVASNLPVAPQQSPARLPLRIARERHPQI